MKIYRLTDGSLKKNLSQAERILKSCGIIIVPTDTVYGILGDATKQEVIKKIFAMKDRAAEKALPIFVRSVADARKCAYISDAKAKFLEKVWPGAVTVVFQHKEKLPKILTGGKNTIGVRIPDDPFLLELLARLNFPLAQTSANISGMPAARNFKEVEIYFKKAKIKPDLVVDGGELHGKSSTVVDFTGKELMILRTGVVSRNELDKFFSEIVGG